MSSIYTNGNNSYFYSNKIKVFPCAYRSNAYDATARLNTEHNFTHLPHTVDKASYIIKFNDISENEPKAELICVIQGYYFEIELGTGDYATLNNKYLNICVASPKPPEGTDFIEGPHLCSWNSHDGVEATLDGKPEGSDYYIFKGLKIGEGALSNGSYQCYALKLDASAKLPIMANKIEDSAEDNAGVPISNKFTTGTLSAATIDATTSISTPSLNVASDKLIANSDNIIANVPVTINSTLDVKTGDTSVLKAESTKVTINKPTYIKGTTEIKNSSDELIFSVDTASGETYAKKINVATSIAETPITDIFGSTESTIDELKLKTINPGAASYSGNPIKIVVGADSNNAVEFYSNNEGTASIIKADKFDGEATAISDNAVTTIKIADNNVTNAKLENSSITIGTKEVTLGSDIGTSNNPFTGILYFGDSKESAKDCKLIINSQSIKNVMEFPLEIRSGNRNLIKFTNNYGADENKSVPKQIIYAAAGSDHNGKTELFGDKICIYAQGHTYTSGTIEAGTVDLSKGTDNVGLKIAELNQIKVNGTGLKSSSLVKVDGSTVKLCDSALVVASNSVKLCSTALVATSASVAIGSKLTLTPSSGNIVSEGTISANTFNASSDRRLKENIIDYKPEKSILDLPIKKFDFIDGPKNQIGCIAQDLKEICPEIVNENEKGYLSIQESKLVYLLLDEVKKLKNEVEKLKRK